ncbi:hypothethical protein (plasmid) [Ralstonia solanacearum CMR15]|nr:hypothethical protein [Ralstonia solanacearum CMR15]
MTTINGSLRNRNILPIIFAALIIKKSKHFNRSFGLAPHSQANPRELDIQKIWHEEY